MFCVIYSSLIYYFILRERAEGETFKQTTN